MSVVVNGHDIIAGVYFGHTLFLLFINDMPRDIIKHIYAVDSIIYDDTSKTEDIRSFATDSDLALTA